MGIGYFVLVTVSRANMNTLAETSAFLKERGIAMLRSPFVPRGAAATRRDLMFSREDMKEIIHPVLCSNHLAYVSYTPFFASPSLAELGLSKLGISLGQLGCQAARGYVGVSPEGDVAPCVHLLDSAAVCGNVRQTPLSTLFNSHPVLVGLRSGNKLKGRCSRCRYRIACGGCRALAFYSSGDCFAEDPTCFFEPRDERDKSEYDEETSRNTGAFIEFIATNSPWRDIFAGSPSGQIGAFLIRFVAALRSMIKPFRRRIRKHENPAH